MTQICLSCVIAVLIFLRIPPSSWTCPHIPKLKELSWPFALSWAQIIRQRKLGRGNHAAFLVVKCGSQFIYTWQTEWRNNQRRILWHRSFGLWDNRFSWGVSNLQETSKINLKWKCTKSHNLPKKSKVRLHGNHFLVLNDNITHVLLFSQFDWEENTLNLQKKLNLIHLDMKYSTLSLCLKFWSPHRISIVQPAAVGAPPITPNTIWSLPVVTSVFKSSSVLKDTSATLVWSHSEMEKGKYFFFYFSAQLTLSSWTL